MWQYILGSAVAVAVVEGTFALIKQKQERKAVKEDKEEDRADIIKSHIADFDKQKSSCADNFAEQKEKNKEVENELTIICYGLLGALNGLIELGCDGKCKSALNYLEKYLNKKAHNNIEDGD